MKADELRKLSILELRELGVSSGIKSKFKESIIMALADDYREGEPVAVEPSTNGSAPAPVPQPDNGESTIWPEVPLASCDVNGSYVEPPWYKELKAAVTMGHVELMGPAGSGKTLAVHHLAEALGKKLAVVTADGGLRKRDLVGTRELIGGRTTFQVSEFASAAKAGDWALIDEANMAEADALGFLNGMLDRPGTKGSTINVAGKAIDVHPDFRCFLTRNPGYRGTKLMNEALRDRFWSIEVPPLSGDALRLMFKAHSVKASYLDEAVFMVDRLYHAWEQNKIIYQISPRRALAAAAMAAITKGSFRDIVGRSVLTKIDSKHDRDAVEQLIKTIWQALDFSKRKNK